MEHAGKLSLTACQRLRFRTPTQIFFVIRAVTYCVRTVLFLPLGLKFSTAQSKDCQKQGWNLIHKYNCVPSSIPAKEQALMKPRTKIISAWQNRWRNTLDAFSVLALDLENNPGKNATHWYVLYAVIVFSSDDLIVFSMWLEFKYTGSGGDSEKFRVLHLFLCSVSPSPSL